jgi:hypothetical protein
MLCCSNLATTRVPSRPSLEFFFPSLVSEQIKHAVFSQTIICLSRLTIDSVSASTPHDASVFARVPFKCKVAAPKRHRSDVQHFYPDRCAFWSAVSCPEPPGSPSSTRVCPLKASLAIMVFKTAQLKAASPGGITTKIYVLSVNLARKQLNCSVCTFSNTNPAEAGVVRVLRATQCLYVFMILLIRSCRSAFGFSSPYSVTTFVTVRNVLRSNRTISSAPMRFAKALRNFSMTTRFGIILCTIPAQALYNVWSQILLAYVSTSRSSERARISRQRSS